MCIKTAYRKKIVSNIPVLVSACFTRPIYHSQYSYSQELFVRFMAMGCRKCYTIENISKFLRRMKVNGGDYILRWYSGGIFFQNTSPVEKNEDYFILTWNSGYIKLIIRHNCSVSRVRIINSWAADAVLKGMNASMILGESRAIITLLLVMPFVAESRENQ